MMSVLSLVAINLGNKQTIVGKPEDFGTGIYLFTSFICHFSPQWDLKAAPNRLPFPIQS